MNDSQNIEETKTSNEDQWPRTVTLRHPIEFGADRTIRELTFKRPTLAAMRGLKVDGVLSFDTLFIIASRLCAEPMPVIERLDVEDAGEVMRIAVDFFGQCLAGGSAP